MKDFLKVAWIDETSKSYWQDKIHSFQNIYSELELSSVGVSRQSAIISVDPHDLPNLSEKVCEKGWSLQVLSMIPRDVAYSSNGVTLGKDEPFRYRVLISVKQICKPKDDYVIGRYLGYPLCCVHSFSDWWGKVEDPTFLIHKIGSPTIQNVLYRQLGVRLVRHLPCNASCRESKIIAESIYEHVLDLEPSTALAIRKFLMMDAHVTRLHGVAEVTTPIVKYAYNTDYTPSIEMFHLKSNVMVRFNSTEYTLNGFSSLQAQDRAHDPIIMSFLQSMKDIKNPNPKVIDYGCGNGALLEKFGTLYPNIIAHGIDSNEAAIASAEQRLSLGKFHIGNLFTNFFPGSFDITAVSVKRFFENPDCAPIFLDHCRNHSLFTILYDYDNGGPIHEQLAKLNLMIDVHKVFRNNACEAVLVRW